MYLYWPHPAPPCTIKVTALPPSSSSAFPSQQDSKQHRTINVFWAETRTNVHIQCLVLTRTCSFLPFKSVPESTKISNSGSSRLKNTTYIEQLGVLLSPHLGIHAVLPYIFTACSGNTPFQFFHVLTLGTKYYFFNYCNYFYFLLYQDR